MPRKKIIDTPIIKIKNINEEIVEKKDCLQVNLVFNEPLSKADLNVMQEYFKISIAPDNKTITRAIKNSWKGLVMLMLSLTYCKYRDSTVKKIWDYKYFAKDFKLRVDYDYEFIARETKDLDNLKIKKTGEIPVYELVYYFSPDKQIRESYIKEREKKDAEEWENILTNLPPDNSFEQIAAPEEWGPCYVKGPYEPENIVGYLKGFCQLLGFDSNQSCVTTQYSTQLPHEYTINPAKYVPRKKKRV